MNVIEKILLVLLGLILLVLIFVAIVSALMVYLKAVNTLIKQTHNLKGTILFAVFSLLFFYGLIHFSLTLFHFGNWDFLKYIAAFLGSCLISYPFVTNATWAVKRISNVAPKLMSGPRSSKFPFKTLSGICYLLCVACVVMFIVNLRTTQGNSKKTPYNILIVPLFVIGHVLRRVSASYKQQPVEAEMNSTEDHVLYLRGFVNETKAFYYGKYLNEFGNITGRSLARLYGIPLPCNFESYIAAQVKAQLGEFVGLGNPEGRMPHEMIKMFYHIDDWKLALDKLLKHSSCIILQPSSTEGLKYEVEQIVKFGLVRKTFILTPPKPKGFINQLLMNSQFYVLSEKKDKWPSFQKILHECGIRSNLQALHGTVIAFSNINEAIVLKSDCQKPSDYINVIKKRLGNKDLI
jgi:hypothetical protein